MLIWFVLELIFVIAIILVALIFDFTNGFHDAANSVATIISTRMLSPKQAVIWAAFFNFIAFLIFGTAVAKTVGGGLVNIDISDKIVILSGLLGTVFWNIFTWYLGLPTSSSHALIGGYAGAAIAKVGFGALILGGWVKIIIFMFLAPVIGFVLGMILDIIFSWCVCKKSPDWVKKVINPLRFVSSGLYSLGHGGNDAQKTMGIIVGLLIITGYLKTFEVPLWVVLACHSAIALGTVFGGWRIIKTMGSKITKLNAVDGLSAEVASAGSIFWATFLGVPISTTHVLTGAISGVGAAKRFSAVHWSVTLKIVWAWLLTIPCSGLMGWLIYLLISNIK